MVERVRDLMPRRRYHTLDGMRGIAAIMVLLLHTAEYSHPISFRGAYLAVDLFFLLSGVVLAEAYGSRLQTGALGFWGFLRTRFIRLYPLYILGTFVALVPVLMVLRGVGTNPEAWTVRQALIGLAFALFMLPALVRISLYPLLAPAWSLCYEMTINSLWAGLRGDRLRTGGLLMGVAMAGGGLVWAAFHAGNLDLGTQVGWGQFGTALCRVTYSFGLGLAIQRLAGSWRLPKLPAWLVLASALALLMGGPDQPWRPAYDLAVVMVLFPVLVLLGSVSEPASDWGRRLFDRLGRSSYGLYTLHWGFFLVFRGVARRLFHWDLAALAPWPGLFFLAGMFAVVLWLDRHYDDPVRRRWTQTWGVSKG